MHFKYALYVLVSLLDVWFILNEGFSWKVYRKKYFTSNFMLFILLKHVSLNLKYVVRCKVNLKSILYFNWLEKR